LALRGHGSCVVGKQAFHPETERVIGNDWVVRHDNRYCQVKAQSPRRNKTVTPKADHPWRHNSRKMALGTTTEMAVSDAISVAVSSTSP
jgi:hypothetical protein